MKKYSLYLAAVIVLASLGAITISAGKHAAAQVSCPSTTPSGDACLSGWAWSSNIGWLSFNSNDAGAGSANAYGVYVDPASGNLGGYAWSPNIGWVDFGSNSCGSQANINLSSGAVTGWAQAPAADNNGWNGCVELSGTNHATGDATGASGVTYVPSSGALLGYSWGGTNVGWLQFYDVTCVNGCAATNNASGLTFLAQDYGPGSSSTGAWLNSVTFTIPSSGGSVSVPIKWTANSVKSVQTASADWPEGTGKINSTDNESFSTSGSDTVTFSTSGLKVLTLSYIVPGVGIQTATVDITIDPYSSNNNPTTCSTPTLAALCSGSSSNGSPSQTSMYDYGQCPATVAACQFYCPAGYNVKNNSCVKSSIQEI